MTNQEAIKTLYEYRHCFWDKLYEPICMAINALEQESSGDLISRQAVLDGVDRYIYKSQSTGTQDDFYSFAELVVKALPSVNPQEPKTGHWIADVFVDECSVCGEQTLFFEDQQKNFCPNCGAKMESEEKE